MEGKEKLTYDPKILVLMRLVKSRVEKKGYEFDTRYIDYYGDQCPRCGGSFKVYRGIVQGAASVSSFVNTEQKKAIVYSICKKCAKEVTMVRFANESSEQTEERIFAKLPDLKRKHKATEMDMRRERNALISFYESD